MDFLHTSIINTKGVFVMHITKIIKRNGTHVPFQREKIEVAMKKAFLAQAYKGSEDVDARVKRLTDIVVSQMEDNGIISVEGIQDTVEDVLMRDGAYSVARAYVKYRYNRELARRQNTTDESILSLIRGDNEELNRENSNKSPHIASTQRDYIAGEVSRDLTRRVLLPEKIRQAHDDGILHFHDMDYFLQPIHNCILVNIGDMLDNGLVMNDKLIETPKSFRVACTVTTQIIACVASNQYGGQSVDMSHLGKYLRVSRDKYRRKYAEACPELPEGRQVRLSDPSGCQVFCQADVSRLYLR